MKKAHPTSKKRTSRQKDGKIPPERRKYPTWKQQQIFYLEKEENIPQGRREYFIWKKRISYLEEENILSGRRKYQLGRREYLIWKKKKKSQQKAENFPSEVPKISYQKVENIQESLKMVTNQNLIMILLLLHSRLLVTSDLIPLNTAKHEVFSRS